MSKLTRMAQLYLPDVDKSVVASDVRPKFDISSAASVRIERLLARIVVIEFLAIAATCFITSMLYFYAVLTVAPPNFEYVSAALFIALLIVLLSLGFKQYVAIQAQSRDRYMLSGLGAVALGFSLFLSCLFLFKIGDWYSRGTFFSQFFASLPRYYSCAGWHTAMSDVLFSPAQLKRERPSLSVTPNRTPTL